MGIGVRGRQVVISGWWYQWEDGSMYKLRVERLLKPYAPGRQEEACFLFQNPWTIEVVGSWNLTKTN